MSGNVTAVVPFSKKLEWVVDGPAPLVLAGQGCRRSHAPAEGHDSWKPAGAIVGEGVSLVFIRADAVAICRDVTPRGIQASEPQVGNGMWVTSLSDPGGYRIDFESETDTPEETMLSQIVDCH